MNNAEYIRTQQELITLAENAASLNLVAFIERLNKALIVGPLTDPTLYRTAAESAERILHLAQMAQKFVKALTGISSRPVPQPPPPPPNETTTRGSPHP